MATIVYTKAIHNFLTKTIDLEDDTIKAALIKSSPAGSPDNKDHDFVDDVITGGVSTECDFTNYARKTLANVDVAIDDANNRVEVSWDAAVWTNAGGASNNTVGAMLIYWEVTNDADSVPIAYFDFGDVTTDGTDLTISCGSEGAIQGSG